MSNMSGFNSEFLQSVANGTASSFQGSQSEGGQGASNEVIDNQPPNDGGTPNADPTKPDAGNEEKVSEKEITDKGVGAAATEFNEIEYISKISGGKFNTIQQLSEFIGKHDHFNGLESSLSEKNAEIQKLIDNQPKFANDYVSKLNTLMLGGANDEQINAFTMLNKVDDLKSLDPLEIRKMALVLKKGLTAAEAGIYLKDQYSLDEELEDEETVARSKVRLKIDATDDLEYLEQHKAKLSEIAPPAFEKPKSPEEIQAELTSQRNEYLKSAGPAIKQMLTSMDTIKGQNVNGKTGEDALMMDLPISQATKSLLESHVSDFAAANNININDPKGIEILNGYARRLAIVSDFDNIIAHVNASAEKRMAEKFHNPSNIDRVPDKEVQSANDFKRAAAFVLGRS